MKTRVILLLCACIVTCAPRVAGQVRTMTDAGEKSNSSDDVADKNESYDWSAGGGIGQTKLYAQLPLSSPQNAYFIYFVKDEGHGLSYGATLSAGGLESTYPYYNLGSYNQFTSFDLHFSISFSTFFSAFSKRYNNYNNIITKLTDNLYLGIGAGAINNDITSIKPLDTGKITVIPDSGKPIIKTKSVVPYLPFNVGYNLHITKRLVLNPAFQYTWCLGNYVDGYNMPFSGHKHTAVYTVVSIGARYYITRNHKPRVATEQ